MNEDINNALAELDQQEAMAIQGFRNAITAYFEGLAAIRGARQALQYIDTEEEDKQENREGEE